MDHSEYVERLAGEVATGCLSMDEAAALSRRFATQQLAPNFAAKINLRTGQIRNADDHAK